jgi:DNA repair protein RadC
VREIVTSYRPTKVEKPAAPVNVPAVAASLFRPLIGSEPVEVFAALLLDGRHRVIALSIISRGTLTASLVHPRDTFRAAISANAAAILVAHNHPSGDEHPSEEDRKVTRRLLAAGKLLGIPVLDSLVIGEGEAFTSLREEGRCGFE